MEAERARRRGGSRANLYYICFIHVVDTRVILMYDYWTVPDCGVWKRAKQLCAALQIKPPPHDVAPTIICAPRFFSLQPNIW